jgi:hypothetical protein
MKLADVKVGDQLLWQHRQAKDLQEQAKYPEQLRRFVTVTAVFADYIKTDFGDYLIRSGFNTDAACGCKRFCNCWGEVLMLENSQQE